MTAKQSVSLQVLHDSCGSTTVNVGELKEAFHDDGQYKGMQCSQYLILAYTFTKPCVIVIILVHCHVAQHNRLPESVDLRALHAGTLGYNENNKTA